MNKIHIKKGSVQETLIIPLYENHRNEFSQENILILLV